MLRLANDKNESIFLWLLEQERQKDRARQLKEIQCDTTMQPPNTLPEEFFYEEKFQEEKNLSSASSELDEPNDFEHLLKEKAKLEEESHCLDEQQDRLNLQIQMLLEKAVEEKKKKNNEERDRIIQLQARIKALEDQLGSLFV